MTQGYASNDNVPNVNQAACEQGEMRTNSGLGGEIKKSCQRDSRAPPSIQSAHEMDTMDIPNEISAEKVRCTDQDCTDRNDRVRGAK